MKKFTRRQAAQTLSGRAARISPSVPLDELVNSLEFETQAKEVLSSAAFETIAGSDRSVFDRFTFRPRMNVPTLDMDLSVDLWGQSLFTPIVVGPVSRQERYHPEGERAVIAGAASANTIVIGSQHSSLSLSELAAATKASTSPLWVSILGSEGAQERARAAVGNGASVVFVAANAAYDSGRHEITPTDGGIDWRLIETLRRTIDVPLVIKGIGSEAEARRAVELDVDGIVVSSYGGRAGGSTTAPIDALLSVADVVGRKTPLLIDGSFRRATDILVALIVGARAVLISRPVMWALAAYGAPGVRTLLKMMQTDLARCFAMLGASNVSALSRDHLTIHTR